MLQIRMLGKFEALLDGQVIAGLGPQLRRLLARLCLEGNRTIEHARLLRDLWPDSESGDVVRKSLLRLWSLLGSEERRLKAENATASFDLNGLDIDLKTFSEQIDQGTPEAIASAVKLYKGMLLEDWEDPWIVETREDYEVS